MSQTRPETRYTSVGDADVAYQVLGDGPIDLLYFWGLGSHVDWFWEDRLQAALLEGLASIGRLIRFDRRGTGASDAVPHNAIPTWEDWTEDVGAVLDAVGSKQATIMATIDGGPISILYTVAHPERVNALILYNTAARYMMAEDYPIGAAPEAVDSLLQLVRTQWGKPEFQQLFLTDEDPARLDLTARVVRSAATPRSAVAQYEYVLRSVDVRPALSLIRVPTLVLHTREQPILPVAHGHYLADHIAGAKFVELPGRDLAPTSDPSRLLEEIAEFLTGERPIVEPDRILATVLFTDIVGSSERASHVGDHAWRKLLDAHDGIVRAQLERFRGREVKTTGDGFLATFDGPARAVRCAQAICEVVRPLGVEVRAGLHTGEVELRDEDIGGIAVHIGQRVTALARPGEVLVSRTVTDLVAGSGIEFDDRGERVLKGVPGSWRLFAVAGG
jgi:class 3 adenylate cyclase